MPQATISYTDPEVFKEENGYTVNGAWYPRVTRIVAIKAKPALLHYYAASANFKQAEAATERSAAEGTLVHEAAEAILLGKVPEVHPTVRPAIDAFRQFIAEKHIHTIPEHVERRIVHEGHRYAGTVDAIAEIDGKLGVLDIKTSQSIYRDYNLQTAAYMDALKDQFQNLETRWILRIDQAQTCAICGATKRTKGGNIRIRRNGGGWCPEHMWSPTTGVIDFQEFPSWQSDFEGFLGAKRLWEWENEAWLKKIGYL